MNNILTEVVFISIVIFLGAGGCAMIVLDQFEIGVFLVAFSIIFSLKKEECIGENDEQEEEDEISNA